MDLQDKVALVTGGASGIGLSFVKIILENGVKHVAILDFDQTTGTAATKKIKEQFGVESATFILCDVTKKEELEACFKKTIDMFKNLHIVANCAGTIRESQFEEAVAVNFTGLVRTTMLALDYMGKDKGGEGGAIINMASRAALVEVVKFPVYCATKAAVIAFSRSIGAQFHEERTGVRVLTLCPSLTETPLLTNTKHYQQEKNEWALDYFNTLRELPMQKPECVASAMVHLLQNAKSGSVWVAEDSKPPYEIKFPHYQTLKV